MGTIMDLLKEIPLSAVLRERLVDKDTELAALKFKNAKLNVRIVDLEKENASLKGKNESLEIKLQKIENDKKFQGDTCPYCQQPQGKLLDIRPHKTLGLVGLKVRYYECQGCGRKYDKEQKLE